jgi:hypothetical protein
VWQQQHSSQLAKEPVQQANSDAKIVSASYRVFLRGVLERVGGHASFLGAICETVRGDMGRLYQHHIADAKDSDMWSGCCAKFKRREAQALLAKESTRMWIDGHGNSMMGW